MIPKSDGEEFGQSQPSCQLHPLPSSPHIAPDIIGIITYGTFFWQKTRPADELAGGGGRN